mgnify:CR=1 FL=1
MTSRAIKLVWSGLTEIDAEAAEKRRKPRSGRSSPQWSVDMEKKKVLPKKSK